MPIGISRYQPILNSTYKTASVNSYLSNLAFIGSISLVKKIASIASLIIPITVAVSILKLSKQVFQIFHKSKRHIKYRRIAGLRGPKLRRLRPNGKIGSIHLRNHLARQQGEMIEKRQNLAPKLMQILNESDQTGPAYFAFLKTIGICQEKIESIRDLKTKEELIEKLQDEGEEKFFEILLENYCKHVEITEKLLKNPLQSYAYQKQMQEKLFSDFGLAQTGIRLFITTVAKIINLTAFILFSIGIATLPTAVATGLGLATIGTSIALKVLAFGLLYRYKPHTAKEQLKLTHFRLKTAKWQKGLHKIFYNVSRIRLSTSERKLSSVKTVNKWEKRVKRWEFELKKDNQKIKAVQRIIDVAGLNDFKKAARIDKLTTHSFDSLPQLIFNAENQKNLSSHFKGFIKKECRIVDLSTKRKIEKPLRIHFGGTAL